MTETNIVAQASAIVRDMAPAKNVVGGRELNLVEDLGFDSLAVLETIVAIEAELGLRLVGRGPAPAIVTMGDVEDYVRRLAEQNA